MNDKNYLIRLVWIGFFSASICSSLKSQQVGMRWGIGSQQIFPFGSGSYRYDVKFFQFTWSKPFKTHTRWNWLVEPGYFRAHHQLTNPWYKLDERNADYARRIPEFQENKTIQEIVCNFGISWNYPILPWLSGYLVGSIGPMYTNTETERLARGLAFSDIAGVGFQGNWERWTCDLRLFIRHVSNANLKFPNNGHNSSNLGLAILYRFSLPK